MDNQGHLIGVQRTCTDPGRTHNPVLGPCSESPKVAVIWPEKDRKILADKIDGKDLGRPNDLVVSKNGTVYFNGGGTLYVKRDGRTAYIENDLN